MSSMHRLGLGEGGRGRGGRRRGARRTHLGLLTESLNSRLPVVPSSFTNVSSKLLALKVASPKWHALWRSSSVAVVRNFSVGSPALNLSAPTLASASASLLARQSSVENLSPDEVRTSPTDASVRCAGIQIRFPSSASDSTAPSSAAAICN